MDLTSLLTTSIKVTQVVDQMVKIRIQLNISAAAAYPPWLSVMTKYSCTLFLYLLQIDLLNLLSLLYNVRQQT